MGLVLVGGLFGPVGMGLVLVGTAVSVFLPRTMVYGLRVSEDAWLPRAVDDDHLVPGGFLRACVTPLAWSGAGGTSAARIERWRQDTG